MSAPGAREAAPLKAAPTTDGRQPDVLPAYRRLHAIGRDIAARRSPLEQQQARLVATVAEMIDAHAFGFVVERDGTLALRDFALDARYRADHLSIGNELRLAASEALRTREPRVEPSASVPGAFVFATSVGDGRGAIAAIKGGGETALSATRATLELSALALSLDPGGGVRGESVKALAALSISLGAGPASEPASLADRLAAAFTARMVFIAAANGEILASAPAALHGRETPVRNALRSLAKRCADLDSPLIVRASDDGEKQVADELSATRVVAFRIGDRRARRDRVVIIVEPGPAFVDLDASGWTIARALFEADDAPLPVRRNRDWRPKRSVIATGVVAVAALAALLVPVPDRIRAEAELEADGRHFVSASFSGVLREAKVKAGDVVRKDDTIAVLEGEALQLARSTAASKADEAFRRRDAAIREKRITDAELARNEGEAAASERDLLDWQLASLELKAPVDGVVLDSPLEQSAGAPVREGDIVVEIAPLQSIRARVDVPVESLARLPESPHASLYLDGVRLDAIEIERFSMAPEVETRNGRTVLPLRAVVANATHALRPGQRGVAVIPAGHSLLGEILFRDAWIAMRRWWR